MPTYATGHVRRPNKDHLIALKTMRHGPKLLALGAVQTLPPSYDAQTLGIIGAVKDQSSCGSCWDFSGTAVVEIAFCKSGLQTADKFALSEEYTLSCCRNGGCNGDDNTTVLDWAKHTGLPLTSDYGKYTGGPGRCAWKQGMPLFKIDDWGFADGSGGSGVTPVDQIKQAIYTFGCVGAAIAADNAFMNNPSGKVFDHTTSRGIDHDIVLVGWDDSKGSKGAWRLRNSWGSSWCESGYCWIGYGVNLVGTEAVWAVVKNPNPPAPSPLDWFS